MTEITRQRLDKWLWHARVTKTRTRAQKLIQSGAVRINGRRVLAPDHRVGVGDGLTFILHERLRVLKVLGLAERRGSAQQTAGLFEDVSPDVPRRLSVPERPVSAPAESSN